MEWLYCLEVDAAVVICAVGLVARMCWRVLMSVEGK